MTDEQQEDQPPATGQGWDATGSPVPPPDITVLPSEPCPSASHPQPS
jgi:hypothetical protein